MLSNPATAMPATGRHRHCWQHNVTAQAMGESVKALEKRGLLDKTNSAEDGRTLLIRRGALGCETYTRCNRAVRKAEEAFFSCLRRWTWRACSAVLPWYAK